MREVKVITVPFDSVTGTFDDGPLRGWLATRELVRAEPAFFMKDGVPGWSVFVEARPMDPDVRALLGVTGQSQATPDRPPAGGGKNTAQGRDAAMRELTRDFDESERARLQRLLSWRAEAARRDGVPSYVIFKNAHAVELARRMPRSLEALRLTPGMGKNRVSRYGREVLEVLHGPVTPGPSDCASKDPAEPTQGGEHGAEGLPAVREVDGHDRVAVPADAALPQDDAAHTDPENGRADAGGT